jgi:hypothetical protein
MNQLQTIISNGWSIPEELTVVQFGQKYLRLPTSPFGSRFRPEMSPHLLEPLEALKDEQTRIITLKASAQSSKTTALLLGLAWAMSEQPSPLLCVTNTDDLSKKFARQRVMPLLESCSKLKHMMPTDRHEKNLRELIMPNGSLLIGPANESFLRSHSVRFVFADECGIYKEGMLPLIKARCTQYYNHKIFLCSTPMDEQDSFSKEYDRGTQNVYHLRCPECNELINPNFHKVIKWESNELTKPSGDWNIQEVQKTVYMECNHCSAHLENTDKNWQHMVGKGQYIALNPNAPKEYKSYTWNSLILSPTVCKWSSLVEEFLTSQREAKAGLFVNMKEFLRLRLAQGWAESKANPIKPLLLADYKPDESWQDSTYNFMGVDCGGNMDIFWVGVRSFQKNGDSKLIHYSRVSTWEEVEAIRAKYCVKPHLVGCDIGFEKWQVLEACAKYGYTGLRGEDSEDGYLHKMRHSNVRRPFSPPIKVDSRDGKNTMVTMFRWSNLLIKDLLHVLRTGQGGNGAKWEVADVGEWTFDYLKQIDGERKKITINKRTNRQCYRWIKTGANHALDIECEILVFSTLASLSLSNRKEEAPLEEQEELL